jgi:predicted CXXCH cytochrome family protein
MSSQRRIRFGPLLISLALVFSLGLLAGEAFAQKMPEAAKGPSVTWQFKAESNPGDYVGADRCKLCHDAEATQFEKTVHAKFSVPGKNYVAGCEVCHGPGKAHAEAMEAAVGDDAKVQAVLSKHLIFAFHANPQENSARCLECHVSGKQQEEFAHSQHAAVGVACDQCHSPHLVTTSSNQGHRSLTSAQANLFQVPQLADSVRWLHNSMLKDSEPSLCFTCHGNIQALFALPVHHRVPEQLMKCTDCHNPHGSINRAMLNATNWETCVKCHVEKRGPYVYEHPAVKVSGCVICHNPHGSTNRMLLVRREGRLLCLQCHTGFHTQAGVPHSRLGFQASGECTRCHVTIHGSNLDPYLLR